MTLTDFLLARIAEDEAAARPARDESPAYPHFGDTPAEETLEMALNEGCAAEGETHFSRWLPDRVLAECEAKRRIVELHDGVHECEGPNRVADPDVDGSDGYGGPCYTLMFLALPYASHPDYRESWKP